MKNKLTAKLSVFMCLVLIVSCFAACNIDSDDTVTTTLAPNDSWQSGTGYDKVVISQAELVDLVENALGDDAPDNFNGDLSTLTPEQLDKVEDYAKDEGLTVEKDENGDTVIKKEEIPTTQASKDEVEDLFNKLSIKDPSNLSDEEYEELSKVASSEGYIVQTEPDGDVVIAKPVTTTKIFTRAPDTTTKKNSDKTTKNSTPKTTSVYRPNNHPTAAPTGAPTSVTISKLSNGWSTNFGTGSHCNLVGIDVTSDGGSVVVGVSSENGKGTHGVIMKYDEKGNMKWSDSINGDKTVSFEDVAVLKDGSIIVVGYTSATNIASPDDYVCKDTVEGIIVKYSAKGERQWLKIIGGSGAEMIYAVEATPDGGFVLGGKSTSSDGDFADLSSFKTKAFLFKFTASGSLSWRNALAGTIHCAVQGIAVNTAGEIFTTMENNSPDGDFANLDGSNLGKRIAVISKFTPEGKKVWVNSVYETGIVNMHAITFTNDGGCVVAGQYSVTAKEGNKYSFGNIYNGGTGGTFDAILVKYRADGSRSWVTPLIGFESDFITGITRISNGFAVSGYSASNNRDFQKLGKGNFDSFVYTVNTYGEAKQIYGFGGSASDHARAICSNGDTLYLCGMTNSSDGDYAGMTPAGTEDNAVGIIRCYNLS